MCGKLTCVWLCVCVSLSVICLRFFIQYIVVAAAADVDAAIFLFLLFLNKKNDNANN